MTEKKIIAIDSQMLETIQLCPRKWYYSFIRQLQTNDTKDYFQRGDLLHQMLSFYYDAIIHGADRNIAMQLAESKGYIYASELSLSSEDCETTVQNFVHYSIYYSNDQWLPVFTEKVAAKVIYEDENYQFLYQGKIDLGVNIPGVKGIIPIDHKSVKRKGTSMDLSNQFMGYCFLLDTNNLVKNEIGFQKTLTVEERMKRVMFSYSIDRLEEWKTNTIYWIKQLVYNIEMENWPLNLSSCNKFDGCHFASLCMSDSSSREEKISRLYNVREVKWDPGVNL